MIEKFSWHKSGADAAKNQAIVEKVIGVIDPGITNDDKLSSDIETNRIIEGSVGSDTRSAMQEVVSDADAGLRAKSSPHSELFDVQHLEFDERGEKLRSEFQEIQKSSDELTILLRAVSPGRFNLAKTQISSTEIANIKIRVELLRNAIPKRESQYNQDLSTYESLEQEITETKTEIEKISKLLAPENPELN